MKGIRIDMKSLIYLNINQQIGINITIKKSFKLEKYVEFDFSRYQANNKLYDNDIKQIRMNITTRKSLVYIKKI